MAIFIPVADGKYNIKLYVVALKSMCTSLFSYILFSYFPLYPIKEGISGSTGGEYNEKGKLFIIKCLLANVKLLRLYYYFSKK